MIDIDYLNFLENILTDNRKEVQQVLENRTNHFTIAVEDIFQMHNTSAVMRS
jgi:tRNA (guanosine-2'-O-)-methyltransferase